MKYLGFIIVFVLSFNTIFSQNFLPPTLGVLDFEPRGIPTYISQQFTQLLREEIESEELGIVIERSILLGTLEERGYERSNCITDYCEALVGRLLNADFIVPFENDDPKKMRRFPVDVHQRILESIGFVNFSHEATDGKLAIMTADRL